MTRFVLVQILGVCLICLLSTSCDSARMKADRAYAESLEDCLRKINTNEIKQLAQEDEDVARLLRDGELRQDSVERFVEKLTESCPKDVRPAGFWERNQFVLLFTDDDRLVIKLLE